MADENSIFRRKKEKNSEKEVKNENNVIHEYEEKDKLKCNTLKSNLFLGEWRNNPNYFAIDRHDQPHFKRKKQIMTENPQIQNLYGYSTATKYWAFSIAFLTIVGCFVASKIENIIIFFIFCYFYGATLAALSGIIIHECCHLLAGKSVVENQIIGFIANVPLLIPVSASFKKYHLDHHQYLGVKGKDLIFLLSWK
ncbi:putative sphingolipid delta(4)-desaturase/C4-monooxygenase [Dictyocoela muelleri]|nr:putative sphingolipid delta(4)-desaturase/C4-monooxygenase [Dictyocoela muelleri]